MRKAKPKLTRTISAAVPKELIERLRVIATEERRSFSQIVRMALEDFTERRDNRAA